MLPTILPEAVLLRFLWTVFLRLRGGTPVPLLAGASAGNPLPVGGALPFRVDALPLHSWWDSGSAYNLSIDISYV